MSRIFNYFTRLANKEIVLEKIDKAVRFRFIQDISVDIYKDTYIITLYTPRMGFNIGIQGNVLNTIRDILVNTLHSENIQLNILSVDSLRSNVNKVSAKLITERIGQMILNKLNYKKICGKILNELTDVGVLGAKIELRGPLKKIRREEFKQSIGNYKLILDNTHNCEVCHQAFILPGGSIGVTVTIVHRQEELPDNIHFSKDFHTQLKSLGSRGTTESTKLNEIEASEPTVE